MACHLSDRSKRRGGDCGGAASPTFRLFCPKIAPAVDLLFLVSDPSLRGIIAAGRVAEVLDELKTTVGAVHLIVNRVYGDRLPEPLAKAIEEHSLSLAGLIPADPAVNELDAMGEPIVKLSLDSASRSSLESILASVNGVL